LEHCPTVGSQICAEQKLLKKQTIQGKEKENKSVTVKQ